MTLRGEIDEPYRPGFVSDKISSKLELNHAFVKRYMLFACRRKRLGMLIVTKGWSVAYLVPPAFADAG